MNTPETNIHQQETDQGPSRLAKAGLVGAAALVALGFAPRSTDAQESVPEQKTYVDLAQESAQQPYDPTTDELVIDGIRVKPADESRNTPSEALLSNPEVANYIAQNPDEAASLEASSLDLPTNESGEYVVVGRDIDNDGDTDAVAVPANH
jgi:hypothetical protein